MFLYVGSIFLNIKPYLFIYLFTSTKFFQGRCIHPCITTPIATTTISTTASTVSTTITTTSTFSTLETLETSTLMLIYSLPTTTRNLQTHSTTVNSKSTAILPTTTTIVTILSYNHHPTIVKYSYIGLYKLFFS